MQRPRLPRRALITLGAVITAAALSITAPAASFASPAPAPAPSKHFVDCSQKQNGDGTQGRPWNSLHAVNAHGAFIPGDQILLKRGMTCKGRLVPTGSGSKGHVILLGAYGSTKAALPTVAGGGTGNVTGAVQLGNVHDWTVQDLHVTNASKAKETPVYRSGVFIVNSGGGRLSGITVQRLRVDHVVSDLAFKGGYAREYGGIAVWSLGRKTGDGFVGLRLLNNTVDHVGRTGIAVVNHEYPRSADTGLRISGNKVTWARGDSILLFGSKNARIDHNVSAHGANLWPCKQCGKITPLTANAAIWPANSKGVLIDHNEVYGEHVKGGDGEGFDIDNSAVDVVVEYNYAHDNQGGGILFCGSTNAVARFNIFQNNTKSAFAFIGSLPTKKRTSIYNNTVYNSSRSDARIVRYFNGAHSAPIVFKNNVLYNYSQATYSWPTKKVSTAGNTLIGVHGAGRPTSASTIWANPGLKNAGSGRTGFASLKGYKPKHPSSFTRGVAIPSNVTVDIFGKRINPKHPPRGAAG